MTKIAVIVPKSNEVEATQYLLFNNSDVFWYTAWHSGRGYVTVVEFYSQEEAVEFQLKFLSNIDYQTNYN